MHLVLPFLAGLATAFLIDSQLGRDQTGRSHAASPVSAEVLGNPARR